jgi:hypothetical protein
VVTAERGQIRRIELAGQLSVTQGGDELGRDVGCGHEAVAGIEVGQ